jgi:hypothetical protein
VPPPLWSPKKSCLSKKKSSLSVARSTSSPLYANHSFHYSLHTADLLVVRIGVKKKKQRVAREALAEAPRLCLLARAPPDQRRNRRGTVRWCARSARGPANVALVRIGQLRLHRGEEEATSAPLSPSNSSLSASSTPRRSRLLSLPSALHERLRSDADYRSDGKHWTSKCESC